MRRILLAVALIGAAVLLVAADSPGPQDWGIATTNPLPVTAQSAGASVVCGVASGELLAAAASPRWVRIENETAQYGVRFAIGSAATSASQLMKEGGIVWRYTAVAINCIRANGADVTVKVQTVTQ